MGQVSREQFERLRGCEHPETGEFLRQRRGAARQAADGSKQSNAVCFFDLTFSAPKSVSVEALEDPRLVAAHDKAVAEALAEAEVHAAVEDKRDDKKLIRPSGNLAIAIYRHHASRQLDPQCHTHAVVFNLSYDEETGNWKALHSPSIFARRAYLTEVYRNRFAREVMMLGHEIENRWNEKGTDQSFEIKAIPRPMCQKFSKRSIEKEAAIAEFVEKRGQEPSDNEIAVLVRDAREDQLREITTAEVVQYQRSQLTPDEASLLVETREKAEKKEICAPAQIGAAVCLEFAKEHIFERVSVAPEFEVLEHALCYGRGRVDLKELKTELRAQQ